MKIWDLDKKKSIATLEGHTNLVTSVVKLNDKQIASGSLDQTVRVWDRGIWSMSIL